MPKQIHLLFLPRWYPFSGDPMLGLFVRRHAESVSPFAKVSVVFPFAVENGPKIMQADSSESGGILEIRVLFRSSTCRVKPLRQFLNLKNYYKAAKLGIAELHQKRGLPDICHVEVLTRPGVIALQLKRRFGIPYVVSEHWSRYLSENRTYSGVLRHWVTKRVIKNAAAITAVTRRLKEAMRSLGLVHDKFSILPNAIDDSAFVLAEKPVDSSGKKRIIHVSCFEDSSKNITGILNGVKLLSEKRDDFELLLVGDGEDFEKMYKLAERLHLVDEGFVKFTGVLKNNQIIEAYQSADFSLLYSRYETFGIPIIESLLCGKPVVTTLAGGIADYFSDDFGFAIPICDDPTLASELDRMLDSFHTFSPVDLRQAVISKFGYSAIGKQIMDLYKLALKQ